MRAPVLDGLHQNIQGCVQRFGVQIMSPNDEADPEGPKILPREKWFAAPAAAASLQER